MRIMRKVETSMALNELIQDQLKEKVENGWLTKEEAKKIWEGRAAIRTAIKGFYKLKGDALGLDEELTFIDETFQLCLK